VGLIADRAELFPDQWIYVHTPGVRVGRIQNYTNWSRDLVPDPGTSSLGLEYFCDEGDALWSMSDSELRILASTELEHLGLASAPEVVDGMVIRQPMAYPMYDESFAANLGVLRAYLDGFSNLQTMGRNGMHRYNNQDHSMLSGIQAAGNLFGEHNDLWAINTERSHHESQMPMTGSRV
jgi:protoporphyrinogen oxidase